MSLPEGPGSKQKNDPLLGGPVHTRCGAPILYMPRVINNSNMAAPEVLPHAVFMVLLRIPHRECH